MNLEEKNKQIYQAEQVMGEIAKALKVSVTGYATDQTNGAENRFITVVSMRGDVDRLLTAICKLVTGTPDVASIVKAAITTASPMKLIITPARTTITPDDVLVTKLSFYLKCKNPTTALDFIAEEMGLIDGQHTKIYGKGTSNCRAYWSQDNFEVFFLE